MLLALAAPQIHAAATRGGFWLLLAWSGAAFSIAGAAYLAPAPWVFGKAGDGSMRAFPRLLLLPFLLVAWCRWQLEWSLSSERPWDEVAPGLFLGRRPGESRLPPGVGLVVDMAGELPAPPGLAGAYEYVSLPTLDTTAPEAARFAEVARRVAESPLPAYLHCAVGHGRSATLAAAVLLARGLAGTPAEAIGRLQAARPRVRLETCQRRLLEAYARRLREARAGVSSVAV